MALIINKASVWIASPMLEKINYFTRWVNLYIFMRWPYCLDTKFKTLYINYFIINEGEDIPFSKSLSPFCGIISYEILFNLLS